MPQDWPAYKEYLRQYNWENKEAQPPGRLVLDELMPVDADEDELVEFPIDLGRYLDGKFGHFIVLVQPPNPSRDEYWQAVRAWVQVTHIGLDAYTDANEIVAWATDLQSGAPLNGVRIQPGGESGSWPGFETGQDGLSRFSIPARATYLLASRGADRAILPRSLYFWGEETTR